MRYYTHIIFCILFSLVVFKIVQVQGKVLFIVVALFFALLVDVDESSSKMGRKARPLSFFLKHRGMMHSIWLPALLVFLLYPVSLEISLAIFIGYCSHLIMDAMTKEGIAPFFPLKLRIRGFAKTGGWFEKVLFVVMVAVVIVLAV